MSLPTSLGAYRDCAALYESATADAKGIRACLGSYEAAVQMRTRLHYFRTLDREANATTYPKGHHLHGQTIYDDFIIQLREDYDGEWWVYITARSSKVLAIQSLSEIENAPLVFEANEVQLIEDQSKEGLS